jgi:hypothetical protein
VHEGHNNLVSRKVFHDTGLLDAESAKQLGDFLARPGARSGCGIRNALHG